MPQIKTWCFDRMKSYINITVSLSASSSLSLCSFSLNSATDRQRQQRAGHLYNVSSQPEITCFRDMQIACFRSSRVIQSDSIEMTGASVGLSLELTASTHRRSQVLQTSAGAGRSSSTWSPDPGSAPAIDARSPESGSRAKPGNGRLIDDGSRSAMLCWPDHHSAAARVTKPELFSRSSGRAEASPAPLLKSFKSRRRRFRSRREQ
jgi:hypothetical protein